MKHLSRYIGIICLLSYCLIQYIYFYRNGSFLLGGEGLYWLDYSVYLQKFGYTWVNLITGIVAPSINAPYGFALLFQFIPYPQITTFILVAMSYILPAVFMYLLLSEITTRRYPFSNDLGGADERSDGARPRSEKTWYRVLLSIFYVANPFSVMYLSGLNPWVTHALFIYPLFLWIFIRFYNTSFFLFYIFGIVSLLFAYTFTNPPQMVLMTASFPVLLMIAHLIVKGRSRWFDYFKKTGLVILSFFLFHLWWIMNWLVSLGYAAGLYTKDLAKQWARIIADHNPMIMKDVFSLIWQVPGDINTNFLSYFYRFPAVKFFLFIPFFVVLAGIIMMKKSKEKHMAVLLLSMLAGILLLMKGANPPFAGIILFCFDYIPLCYLFKTAPEKFGVPFVFLLSLILFFVMHNTKSKHLKLLFLLYMLILLVPFVTGKYIPDIKTAGKTASRRYAEDPEVRRFREDMRKKPADARILSLPAVGNYQILMESDDNYYMGVDPILANIPQSSIADYSSNLYSPLFTTLDRDINKDLLGMYSIRYILLNKKMYSWFGNISMKGNEELEVILRKKYQPAGEYGDLILFENDAALPKIYAPGDIVEVKLKQEDKLAEVMKSGIYHRGDAFYFTSQNNNHSEDIMTFKNRTAKTVPRLDYRFINPTKYTVKADDVKGSFFIVFNEFYDANWNIYVKTPAEMMRVHPSKQWVVNGYANAWFIDPASYCMFDNQDSCNLEFVIEYWPQEMLRTTMMISGVVVLVSSIFAVVLLKHKKKLWKI